MRVLITNLHFSYNSGSEVVVELLADGLRRAGHTPMLLAADLGRQAFAARERGHIVVDRVTAIPAQPDIIHAQHATVALAAFAAFPDVPAVFSCHSAVFEVEAPRPHPQIRRWIAVDNLCRDKCLSRGVPSEHLSVIHNAVDLERFARRAALPQRPARALLLTKNTGHHDAVGEACAGAGIALDALGPAVGKVSTELERELRAYDLVFATARMALEAAAVGCAVIVCDGRGFAGMLTSANLQHWRSMNFGVGLLTRPTTAEVVRHAIDRYDADDAGAVTDMVRADASLEAFVARHLAVYTRALADPPGDIAACRAATAAWIEELAPTPTDRAWRTVAREAMGVQTEPWADLFADAEKRVQQELHRHAEEMNRLSVETAARVANDLTARIDVRLDELRRAEAETQHALAEIARSSQWLSAKFEMAEQRLGAVIEAAKQQLEISISLAEQRLRARVNDAEERLHALSEARLQSGLWARACRLWRKAIPYAVRKPLWDLRQRLLGRGPA